METKYDCYLQICHENKQKKLVKVKWVTERDMYVFRLILQGSESVDLFNFILNSVCQGLVRKYTFEEVCCVDGITGTTNLLFHVQTFLCKAVLYVDQRDSSSTTRWTRQFQEIYTYARKILYLINVLKLLGRLAASKLTSEPTFQNRT